MNWASAANFTGGGAEKGSTVPGGGIGEGVLRNDEISNAILGMQANTRAGL